jgi:hypothetical protein
MARHLRQTQREIECREQISPQWAQVLFSVKQAQGFIESALSDLKTEAKAEKGAAEGTFFATHSVL